MKPWISSLATCLVLGAAHPVWAQSPADASRPYPTTALTLGQATVVSQQGQRLKVSLPYSVTNQKAFPVTRVMVQEVRVPEGFVAPDPAGFTISKPANGQVLSLQSRELVRAPKVELVLSLAHSAPERSQLALDIPPASFTAVVAEAAPRAAPPKAAPKAKRKRAAVRSTTPATAKAKAMGASSAAPCGCPADPR